MTPNSITFDPPGLSYETNDNNIQPNECSFRNVYLYSLKCGFLFLL